MGILIKERQYFIFSKAKPLYLWLGLKMEKWSFLEAYVECCNIVSWTKFNSKFYLIIDFIADIEISFLNKNDIIALFYFFIYNILGIVKSGLHYFQQVYHEISIYCVIPIIKWIIFEFIPILIEFVKIIVLIFFINVLLKELLSLFYIIA